MIKPARGAEVNLGDLKGGQSSELSASNKGPGVGSSKSCIGLGSDAGIRGQGLRHEWMARWCAARMERGEAKSRRQQAAGGRLLPEAQREGPASPLLQQQAGLPLCERTEQATRAQNAGHRVGAAQAPDSPDT